MNYADNRRPYIQGPWKVLAYANFYRLFLSGLFIFLYWFEQVPQLLGTYKPFLFFLASHGYFFVSLFLFYLITARKIEFAVQAFFPALLDILFLTILMYANSGLGSGFGLLLVTAVILASISVGKQLGILIAALASLAVLAEEIYLDLSAAHMHADYVQAGLLGITFFITSLVSYVLASRLEKSNRLIQEREIDLRDLFKLNELIVHKMQAGIFVIDNEDRVRLCNQSAQNILNIDSGQGHRLAQISADIYRSIAAWRSGAGAQRPIVHLHEPGVDVQLTFLNLSAESSFQALIFLEDVALLRQHAQRIKLASLGRLTASIAHEIRNPLGAISHAGQLLSESRLFSAEDKRLTAIILEHSQRINNIIENITDISRRKRPTPILFTLRDWLLDFSKEFERRNELQPGAIKLHAMADDLQVSMDPGQLYQVLWNLLENGIRYSKGFPLIEIKCANKTNTSRIYLDIIDHGPGMTAEEQAQLFEPFFSTQVNGTGLGLYIARELCEANMAALSLFRNGKEGCCFRIVFSHTGPSA